MEVYSSVACLVQGGASSRKHNYTPLKLAHLVSVGDLALGREEPKQRRALDLVLQGGVGED